MENLVHLKRFFAHDQIDRAKLSGIELPEDVVGQHLEKLHHRVVNVTHDIAGDDLVTRLDETEREQAERAGGLDSDAGKAVVYEAVKNLVLCLAPFTPHLCEELWQEMGHKTLVSTAAWPTHRPELLVASSVTLVVQVNGKKRALIAMPVGVSEAEVRKVVEAHPDVQKFVAGAPIKKFIYVQKNNLVSVVV